MRPTYADHQRTEIGDSFKTPAARVATDTYTTLQNMGFIFSYCIKTAALFGFFWVREFSRHNGRRYGVTLPEGGRMFN